MVVVGGGCFAEVKKRPRGGAGNAERSEFSSLLEGFLLGDDLEPEFGSLLGESLDSPSIALLGLAEKRKKLRLVGVFSFGRAYWPREERIVARLKSCP